MRRALLRLRGAAGMGLTWAIAWGIVGMGVELVSELFPALPLGFIDIWPVTLALPGFLCGAGFSLVLGLAEGKRRFDELSLGRFAAWGAVGGVMVGGLASLVGFPIAVAGVTMLMGAGSASGTLALARRAGDRPAIGSGKG